MPGTLFRRASVKGLLGGSRAWTVVWVVLAGAKVLRRITRDKPEVLYSEELLPGQAVVVSLKDREPHVLGP